MTEGLQHTITPPSKNVTGYVTLGIKERFRSYFLRYPNSNAKQACLHVHLPHSKYGQIARNVKSEIKRTYDLSYVKADSQGGLVSVHRQLFWVVGGLPTDVVEALESCASQKAHGWYVSRNRNRQLNFKSDSVFIRVLPVSRRCEVLSRIRDRRIDEVRNNFYAVLVASLKGMMQPDFDSDFIARQMKDHLVPSERHKRFHIGKAPFWEVQHYQTTLGVVIKRDLSEKATQLEIEESVPPWIPQLLDGIMELADDFRCLRQEVLRLCKLLEKHCFGDEHVCLEPETQTCRLVTATALNREANE